MNFNNKAGKSRAGKKRFGQFAMKLPLPGIYPSVSQSSASPHGAELISASDSISLQQIGWRLTPSRVRWGLLKVSAILIFVSGLAQAYWLLLPSYPLAQTIGRFFDANGEQSVPTMYSTLLLLLSSISLYWISSSPDLRTPQQARSWRLLSYIFLYLSIDELLSIHEIFADPVKDALNVSGIWYYAWIIPGIVLVSLFFLRFFKFWLGLFPSVRFLFALAAAVFIGGAIGMEMVSGQYVSNAQEDGIFKAMTHAEEFLEMAGISIFLSSLVQWVCLKIQQPYFNLNVGVAAVRKE